MKPLLIMLMAITMSIGASAQHRVYYHVYHPRVYVTPFRYGFGYGYPYFGYPYAYGVPYYGSRPMPRKLSVEIESIKDDYRHRIKETRKDKSISHAQRRQEIRNLKSDRDREIIDAEKNFRNRRMNNQKQYHDNSSSGDNSMNQSNYPS